MSRKSRKYQDGHVKKKLESVSKVMGHRLSSGKDNSMRKEVFFIILVTCFNISEKTMNKSYNKC